MDFSKVEIVNAGFKGGSKGEEIPVKFFISPALAFLYNPFTSLLSHSEIGVSINISKKFSLPIIFFASSLEDLKGLTKQLMVTIADELNS